MIAHKRSTSPYTDSLPDYGDVLNFAAFPNFIKNGMETQLLLQMGRKIFGCKEQLSVT